MKLNGSKLITKSRLLRNAAIYTISSVINSAIPFLLLPILTKYLTPSEYGVVSMFGVLVSFVSPFIGLSVDGAISRIYFEKESYNLKEYISNCIFILLISSSIILLIFLIFGNTIADFSSVPIRVVWLAVVMSFSQFISKIVMSLWLVRSQPVQFGTYEILQSLLNVTLSLVAVVLLKLTWMGRIYAQVITVVFFCIISLGYLLKKEKIVFRFNKNYIRHALGFGIPLIPHALGGVIMAYTDRLFITNMVGIESTGIYTVGYQIGMIINLLTASFNQAYTPWLISNLKTDLEVIKFKIVKLTYSYFVIILLLTLLLTIISPFILRIFVDDVYNQSNIYIVWIALGYAFNGMYMMVTNYIFYAQKTKFLMYITTTCALLNIVLNYIFIKSNGAVGAAQATTIVYLFKFIFTWFTASRLYEMPWRLKQKNQNL